MRRIRRPSRQDGRRQTRANQRSPNVRARWVAKEHKSYCRLPREHKSEKLWHWLTCEGRTSTLQHEEEYSFELPPEDYQAGDEHMCGLYSLYGTRDGAQISDLKLTRGIACPCVWQGCMGNISWRVHGDDITIGGEPSAEKIRDQETGDR